MTCDPDPKVPVEFKTQKDVAEYLLGVWSAGEDCRGKLSRVKEIYAQYLSTVGKDKEAKGIFAPIAVAGIVGSDQP